MQIVISDHLPPSGWDALRAAPDITTAGPFPDRLDLLAALPGADALIVTSATTIDAELFDRAPRLKAVARAGAQLDNVDLDEATRRGIIVLHVPDANLYAVVEHAFGLLLALARRTVTGANELRAGRWTRHDLVGRQLHGLTIGVIGLGRLGREAVARARAFGMQTLAYDPFTDLTVAREAGAEVVGFEELLERSDLILPLTAHSPRTHHLFDAAAFARVKPGAMLVNVVHPGLVDEAALLEALDAGRLDGAALDVFATEPTGPDHPLVNHPHVLAVPHLSQNTVESQDLVGRQIAADLLDALRGDDYRSVANLPFNLETPFAAVRPYIHLASKLGKLQGQLAEGWITKVEVELLGEGLENLVRPVTAVLLSGMLLPIDGVPVNWISAPVRAHEQGIATAQAVHLLDLHDYPNLLVCRIHWENDGAPGSRTVAGTLFADGGARLVQYDDFPIDAVPEGFVILLENDDVRGIVGEVGTRLGEAGIDIANWRYSRETPGGRAVSFINVDARVPEEVLGELERHPSVRRARLVKL
jgi:D-3-phosphoglycerate dehydrogenase